MVLLHRATEVSTIDLLLGDPGRSALSDALLCQSKLSAPKHIVVSFDKSNGIS
jgi:hypothetical protein